MEPKYKVNPLTGELQEYVFEYNGILALRNFTARVEDERLILHAADDVNFSILEALVSEVEINGVVYDNPTAAQEALTRLTFNQNRPVLLDKTLKDLILGAVQKVEGKGLSSNDFTNAYKQQLDALEDYDIELDESTTELKFKKGNNVVRRISLMFLDDEGTKLVYNRTGKTLELRDKRDNLLTSIPVSHFVSNIPTSIVVQNGKIKLMAGSQVIDENTISYNDLADKPDLNFAPANHTHYWDDIGGKPNNLATTDNIKTAIEGIQIGGRNYIVGSNVVINSAYNQTMRMSNELIAILNSVRLVTVSVYIEYSKLIALGNRRLGYEFVITYTDNSKHYVHAWKPVSEADLGGSYAGRFSLTHALHNGKTIQSITSTGLHIQCTAENVKLGLPKVEIGNKPTDWYPAPEDFYNPVGNIINGTRQILPDEADKVIFITNSVDNCALNVFPDKCSVSFRKVFDGGHVNFSCLGRNIIYTGDNQFNGKKGSTAVVSIYGSDCYIDIRNV